MRIIKLTILFVFALLNMATSYGQNTVIKGKVLDKTNAPIVGATVVYTSNNQSVATATSNTGVFVFEGLKNTKGTLRINWLSNLRSKPV